MSRPSLRSGELPKSGVGWLQHHIERWSEMLNMDSVSDAENANLRCRITLATAVQERFKQYPDVHDLSSADGTNIARDVESAAGDLLKERASQDLRFIRLSARVIAIRITQLGQLAREQRQLRQKR